MKKKLKGAEKAPSRLSGLMWWTTLAMAVLATPIIGASMAVATTQSPMGQVAVFIVSCWVSTWLGMWLMRKADRYHIK